MSQRSKIKRPKTHKISILSASKIVNYIQLKYDTTDEKFWEWFFSESSWGDTNILGLEDKNIIQHKFRNYFQIIKDDFSSDADEDFDLEIKNDL